MERFSVVFDNDDYTKLVNHAKYLTTQAKLALAREDSSYDYRVFALTMMGESDGIVTVLRYILDKRDKNA